MIRAKFWIIYRGSVEVFVDPFPGITVEALAVYLVNSALSEFAKKGRPARRRDLVCGRVEEVETGRFAGHRGPLFP